MDPVLKAWKFYNWIADKEDNAELAKNHAYLLGSFWNPEAVKELMGDGNIHVSSNDEFEDSWAMVQELNAKEDLIQKLPQNKTRRRRKIN